MRRIDRLPLLLAAALTLAGCGTITNTGDSGPAHSMDLSRTPDLVPRYEPRSRYGNPDSYVVNGQRYAVLASADGYVERGIASWYGNKFHGQRTSNGEIYDMYGMSAAHRTLPLPTYVQVTNLDNGRRTIVRVNDRGPFHGNRLIDLSYAAASKLGIVETGTARVEVRAIDPGQPSPLSTVATATPAAAATTPQPATPAAAVAAPAAVVIQGADLAAAEPATLKPAGLYLQIGAFASRDNAEQLRSRLAASDGLPPVVIQQGTNGDNAPIFRVRLGPIPNVEEADRLTRRLNSLGVGTPRVVVD